MKRLFERLKEQNTRVGISFAGCPRDADLINVEIEDFDNEHATLLGSDNLVMTVAYRNIAYVNYLKTDPVTLTHEELLAKKAALHEEVVRIDKLLGL